MATPPAIAYMNHGRWVADCPLGCGCALALSTDMTVFDCRVRRSVSEELRRLGVSDAGIAEAIRARGSDEIVTHDCGAQGAAIIWPADPTAVERVLRNRGALNRNWFPHETVEALRAENITHGVRD